MLKTCPIARINVKQFVTHLLQQGTRSWLTKKLCGNRKLVRITLKIFKLYQLDSKQKCPKVLMINVIKAKLCIREREVEDIEDCPLNTDI